jgi:hypothetical protein
VLFSETSGWQAGHVMGLKGIFLIRVAFRGKDLIFEWIVANFDEKFIIQGKNN